VERDASFLDMELDIKFRCCIPVTVTHKLIISSQSKTGPGNSVPRPCSLSIVLKFYDLRFPSDKVIIPSRLRAFSCTKKANFRVLLAFCWLKKLKAPIYVASKRFAIIRTLPLLSASECNRKVHG